MMSKLARSLAPAVLLALSLAGQSRAAESPAATATATAEVPLPVPDIVPPPTTGPTTLLDGPIEHAATRVLLPSDPLPASGQRVESSTEAAVDCGGRVTEVRGEFLVVALTGDCPHVRVRGNGNVLTIVETRRIDVVGDDNAVTWQRYPGDTTGRQQPAVALSGQRNLVAPGN